VSTVADLPTPWSYLYAPQLRVSGDRGGWRSTLAFRCTFANLANFATIIGGAPQTITTTWGSISRIVSLQHPLYPALWADRVQCEATGTASTTSTALADLYTDARVFVDFGTIPYPVTGDSAYMTWEVDQGAVYTTQPGRKFKFASGEPLDQDAGAWSVQNTYILTLYQCPSQGDANIDLLSGKLNNATFFGRPANSLLFGGCKSIYEVSVAGVVRYTKSYVFTYRSYSWNQAYKRDGTLDTPVDPAGNAPYQTGDFNLLFS
jgi:hypothetical protein